MTEPSHGKKILVVEDQEDLSLLISKRLAHAGYKIKRAQDAVFAVKEAREFQPDLILLDLMLPAGGGIGVLKSLRNASEINMTPVLVLTSMKDEQRKTEVLDMGVEGYLEKPYEAETLLKEIERILK